MTFYNNWGPPPPGYGGYPQQQPVQFIAVPQNETEIDKTLKLIKAMRKEEAKKKAGEKPPEKKDEKKSFTTFLQQAALCLAVSPFIILAYALILGASFTFLRGIFTGT